jgi:peptidyl-prolyl cis-trans isomerase D
MMRTMRASAKWIMGVVAFFFVGWMIYGYGMDIAGRGATASNVLAKVNGRTIDAQTFYNAVRVEQERRRQQEQPVPATLEEQQQLEDAVLEQIVQNILLEEEFRRRRIRVTDQEIIEAARTTPPPEVVELPQFQTDGEFDFQKYQRFVASSADPSFLMALEARYRDELPRIKLYEQLTAGVFISDAELWRAYRDRNDSVTVTMVQVLPRSILADSAVRVTDEELQAYYRDHQQEFERPAAAFLSFIAITRRPNGADSAAARARVEAVHEEILGGADFADVAARESADSVSRVEGGDLGEVPRGRFMPAFEAAALALRPGQISEPVETQFGWHVIKLEAKTDSTFHARHILIPIEPAGEHLATIEAQADTLDFFAADQNDPEALDRVAGQLGLPLARAPMLLEGDRLQLGRYTVADASIWAFGGAQPGEISPVIETSWAYYLFRLDSLAEAGIAPLDHVREQVQAGVAAEQRTQLVHRLAGRVKDEVAAGATLEVAAERHDLPLRKLGPFTRYTPPTAIQGSPAVAGAAFGLRVGQTAGPIHTGVGSFFVRTDRKTLADSMAFAASIEQLRNAAVQQARQERVQLALASLREAARVEDRRKDLARAQRQAEQSPLGLPVGY